MAVSLFRAVSLDELADISLYDGFRPSRNSLEGKWFAEAEADAAAWGRLLYSVDPFRIVVVDVPNDIAVECFGCLIWTKSGLHGTLKKSYWNLSTSANCGWLKSSARSMMSRWLGKVRLQWLPPEQGGRRTPIVADQGRYAPTARFSGESEQFSVVMEFDPTDGANPEQATVGLLNPELTDVRRRMVSNTRLEIMEGHRKVADCLIIAVEPAAQEAAL